MLPESNMDKIGWLGSLFLAICGVPEVISTISKGRCDLSIGFLLLWGFGELLILIPAIKDIKKKYLIFNYTINLICIAILVTYKGLV